MVHDEQDQPGGNAPDQGRNGAGSTQAVGSHGGRTVRGVIVRAKDTPVEVVEVHVPDPGPGEVLVNIQACGVCQTDHHYVAGGVGQDYPYLLGHEAAGTVEQVGAGVTNVAPGDFVVLNWRAVCGQCRACRRGESWYCFDTANASQKMRLADGTELETALGIGAFIETTLVAAGQCTKVNPALDPAAAGLLGCGIMAGAGAVLNTAGVRRGESVTVIGCGGVGTSAIAAARLAGATTIIAVDVDDRKLDQARDFGATHAINAGSQDVVEGVRALTDGNGSDVVIDAVGRPQTYRQAFEARDLAGRLVLVGVPDPDAEITLPLAEIFGRGGALRSSWYGDCLPERDFPMLADLALQGRFPLADFVTERIGLDQINQAFEAMARGDVLRSVVMIEPGTEENTQAEKHLGESR